LHHSDIITYALTRLAGQYAREKMEILRDLRNYRAAEASSTPAPRAPGLSANTTLPGLPGRAPKPPHYL
jgi:hypothetical protein